MVFYPPGGVRLGGVCPGGMSAGGSACVGGYLPREGIHPQPYGQTDVCENITFPQLLLRTVEMELCEWTKKLFFKNVAR